MQAVRGEDTKETLALVCDFYGEDFDRSQLQLHLDTLKATFPEDLKSPTLSVHMSRSTFRVCQWLSAH